MTDERRLCECGCGEPVEPTGNWRVRVYVDESHSQRARNRRHNQTPERVEYLREYYRTHRKQNATKQAHWRAANFERHTENVWRKRGINLTFIEYRERYAAQDGRCAICQREAPFVGRGRLRPDHCHETGIVCGLLCVRCNSALGTLGDNAEGLQRALRYLQAAIQ